MMSGYDRNHKRGWSALTLYYIQSDCPVRQPNV
jgi:hypothetical protein